MSSTPKPSSTRALLCEVCSERKAAMKRPKSGIAICRDCFFHCFEEEIHETIITHRLFSRGDRVAIGASGGKDSTVLAHVLAELNRRYDYGIQLVLLSIDEGITGYRDDSLESVKRNQSQYGLELRIVSYRDLYGWSMDDIVQAIGLRNNCTFCGVFRRQALDRGAYALGVDKIATGHNADDIAETVLMNLLRGDVARLQRCTQIVTGAEGVTENEQIPRCKPLKFAYEKEIVCYAHYKHLDYFSTECIYSPNAFRGHVRAFLKDLERIRARSIIDIIASGESFAAATGVALPTQGKCARCEYVSSQRLCKACVLLEHLNAGTGRLAVGKFSGRVRTAVEEEKQEQQRKGWKANEKKRKPRIMAVKDAESVGAETKSAGCGAEKARGGACACDEGPLVDF